MRHSFRLIAFLAISLFFIPVPAHAWDKYAHMIVAQIAYDRLSPSAKAEANRLIEVFAGDPDVVALDDKYKPYNFVTASAWMDDMKTVTRSYNTWHYIDLPTVDYQPVSAANVRYFSSDGNSSNCYKAIEDAIDLMSPQTGLYRRVLINDNQKARALGMLLHLVGDIHQPLHCADRARGGNEIHIEELPRFDRSWPIKNLHAFWDNAYRYGGDSNNIAVVDGNLDEPRDPIQPDVGVVKTDADQMLKQYTPDKATASISDPAHWAAESNMAACDFAFPAATESLTPAYVQKAHDIACRRLVLAGVRLGNLLNALLGTPRTSFPVGAKF